MQAFTSHLATALLLVHMVLGCCFHHAHACEQGCCPEPAANVRACPCHDHAAEAGKAAEPVGVAGDLPNDGEDRHQHSCDGDSCRFVAAERTFEHDRPSHVGPRSPSLVLASHGGDPAAATLAAETVRADAASGTSLRAHLRFCVLQI